MGYNIPIVINILKLGNILLMVNDKIYITDGRALRFVRVALFFYRIDL